ncbi:endonuclease SmrB [Psychrobium sp. MM17-31]|uniref:endonuclease SmrB n=1 Tax=Psychrobium sp. MM17-31 TaxID=2917758 RepID=UPI001EF648A3|nr:endonuclease SmrB [Psychrobium sp. MM17-31]MCG7531714.1 endonuclease SmrB [Psychrobium sp. MM17-31]
MNDENPFSMADLLGEGNVKPLTQDKVNLRQPKSVRVKGHKDKQQQKQAEFYFSDGYVPHLSDEGPMRYCRDDVEKYELKKLRRGDYTPELILDLHGLNQNEAKMEILALFKECKKKQIQCCVIVHGVSGGTLKSRTPYWIAQYPELLAFHQAPLEWGGQGALIVLLDIEPDDFTKLD